MEQELHNLRSFLSGVLQADIKEDKGRIYADSKSKYFDEIEKLYNHYKEDCNSLTLYMCELADIIEYFEECYKNGTATETKENCFKYGEVSYFTKDYFVKYYTSILFANLFKEPCKYPNLLHSAKIERAIDIACDIR